MKKFIVFSVMLYLCFLPVTAQSASGSTLSNQNANFPSGSINGRTEMGRNVAPLTVPNVELNITSPQSGQEVAFSVRLLLLMTVLTLAPSILILLTCFLRFSIVLDFIKRALSLQQVPPTMVLQGIAFFMTIFVMWPVFSDIYKNSYKPLADGQISIEQAYEQTLAEGNDVYLTIDRDFQEQTYLALEKQIRQLLIQKISSESKEPFESYTLKDVFASMIDNRIFDEKMLSSVLKNK